MSDWPPAEMTDSAKPSAMSPTEALAVLGLEPGAPPKAIKQAFRTAVKAARPERMGGDETRFREVIDAWRVLEPELAKSHLLPKRAKAEPEFEISIDEAFEGVARAVEIQGVGRVGVRLPAGMRTGDVVTLPSQGRGEPQTQLIRIVSEPRRAVVGDDLWLTVPVDPLTLEDGGRVEVETPYGPRSIWAPRGLPKDAMLKLKDCGLPAREGHPQGQAYLRLSPDPAVAENGARALLERFTGAWTPKVAEAV